MTRLLSVVLAMLWTAISGCGDDSQSPVDSGADGAPDEAGADVPAADADADSPVEIENDAEVDDEAEAVGDGEDADDADDAIGDSDAGPPPDADGPCTSDVDCRFGEQWCEDGGCVDCDNSGLTCFLACDEGYELYVRNGCHPCECAPVNACTSDADCPPTGDVPGHCYSGWFCPHGCVDDASCCHGNWCDAAGCSENMPEEARYGCCLWPCEGSAVCTYSDCAACDPTCVAGVWQGLDDACGHCTWGGGEI